MSMNMDELLRNTAQAHNAALPFEDWKARILAEAEADDSIPMENILAFSPRKKPFYQKALPYAAAAAVALMFVGIGVTGGFSRLRAPAAAAPAAAAGADMAAAEAPAAAAPAEPAAPAAPAAPAPMEAADTEGFAIPESLSEEAHTYTTLEEPPVPAPAEPAAPAAPESPAEDYASIAATEDGADNGASASASSRGAMIEALSGEHRVSLTAIAPGTSPEEMAEQVSWLSIDPAAEESVPFRLMLNGEETHGIYAVYDAETFEALDFFLPSGLAPETYLFQNAEPGGRYIVTVYIGGELYGFGAELANA